MLRFIKSIDQKSYSMTLFVLFVYVHTVAGLTRSDSHSCPSCARKALVMMTSIKWMFLLITGAISLSNHVALADGQDKVITEETTAVYLRRARATTVSIFQRTRSECSNEFPCRACAGDCDRDSDCKGDLKCFQRNDADDPHPPGCEEEDDNSSKFVSDPGRGVLAHAIGRHCCKK
jgi:hypothetical protein